MRLAICITVAAMALSACGGGSGGANSQPGAAPASGPAITSEADAILHLDQLRAAGFRGGGVRVGVISTGVVNLASYQAAGVLPAGIYISQNTAGTLDEGSWMLELVHQHAPDAVLGFCDGVDLDFNGCIQDLGNNFHADIIVDDILFSGQFYPDATAATVAQLETANDRMVFIHLSGNEQNGGYWQGPFVPAAAILAGSQAMLLDFGIASGAVSDTFNAITVPATDRLRLILNWNDPPHEPANHALTAYLLDGNSQVLMQVSSQTDPTAVLDYTNTTGAAQTVRLAVSLDAGSAQGLLVQVTEGSATCNIECQPLTHANSGLAGGTIGDIADALVVGATFALSPRMLEAWSNQPIPHRLSGHRGCGLAGRIRLHAPRHATTDCKTRSGRPGLRHHSVQQWQDAHQQSILRDFRRRTLHCRRGGAARECGIQSRPGAQGAARHRRAVGSGRLGPRLRLWTCRRRRGPAIGW